jgi:hypothetical protein
MWSADGYGRSFNSANKNGRRQGRPFLYPTFNIIPQIDPHSISQEVAKTSSANLLIQEQKPSNVHYIGLYRKIVTTRKPKKLALRSSNFHTEKYWFSAGLQFMLELTVWRL